MASKETQTLIIEALDFYMTNLNAVLLENTELDVDIMRKIVKLDDIKIGLEAKTSDEK